MEDAIGLRVSLVFGKWRVCNRFFFIGLLTNEFLLLIFLCADFVRVGNLGRSLLLCGRGVRNRGVSSRWFSVVLTSRLHIRFFRACFKWPSLFQLFQCLPNMIFNSNCIACFIVLFRRTRNMIFWANCNEINTVVMWLVFNYIFLGTREIQYDTVINFVLMFMCVYVMVCWK